MRLDDDSVAGEELDRSPEEGDDGGGFVVAENLGGGQSRAIIDRDVHVLPPGDLARDASGVNASGTASRFAMPMVRAPAPRSIRPSFLTSIWISSPGRARS